MKAAGEIGMFHIARTAALCLFVVLALMLGQHGSLAQEMRFALVIGNDEYKAAKLATPANDAGLIADALQSAGFTVTGARNLDQATLRESFREFLGQVSAAGPDAVALVYLSGFGLQFDGENYFVPVDADIQRASDIPLQAIRVSDFTQPLAGLPGRVKIVILDAARQNPFAVGDQPLASGLALVDPIPSMLIAFNAVPGTVAPEEQGPYGAYATSLTEMIGAGGLDLHDLFTWLRLRVSDVTKGAEVPWYADRIDGQFYMTERAAGAPPPPNIMPVADIRQKQISDFTNVDDAYAAALERDTMGGYQQFLSIYPTSPYAPRVAAMLAIRREALIWRHCVLTDTPPAYWSYLRRYPDGPHVWDARRRLELLAAAAEPPPDFAYFDFGVPPPPPDELVYFREPVFMFAGPRYAPPPPPPLFFLPPRPHEFAVLPAPPPPHERFGLPLPAASVVPAFVRPPASVVVRPAVGVPGPAGRPEMRGVSLPAAIEQHGVPLPPGVRPGPTGPLPPLSPPPHGGLSGPPPPPPPPSGAFVRPAAPAPLPQPGSPPPSSNGQRLPTTLKPAPLPPSGSPPPPPSSNGQRQPTTLKPAPLPPSGSPPPPPSSNGQRLPTTLKPAPLPPSGSPPPPPSNVQRQPTTLKPAPLPPPPAPPPHPPAPAPAPVVAHPQPPPPPPHPAAAAPHPAACPPGKRPTPEGCK
jgi:uncharacterized caspase-like protein